MDFDLVEYTQTTFRSLLDSMARPGKINKIDDYNLNFKDTFSNYIIGMAATLLDQEVSFYINNCDFETEQKIKMLTGSNKEIIEKSDYVFILKNEKLDFSKLKKGSLEYPDESATIIYQVDSISKKFQEGAYGLTLQGSGIKDTSKIYIRGITPNILEHWNENSKIYPLGIDFIFVDEKGSIVCIPRSTKVRGEL